MFTKRFASLFVSAASALLFALLLNVMISYSQPTAELAQTDFFGGSGTELDPYWVATDHFNSNCPSDAWGWRNPLPQGNYLYGIAWGNNQFVAVGVAGTILFSPDGIAWASQPSDPTNQLMGITWSGSQFVAVGYNGAILTSPNGIDWISQSSGTSNDLYGLAWGNNQFVVVGYSGVILTSPDGVNWTTQTSGTTNHLGDVTWNGEKYVAVGGDGTILTSPDGANWTAQASGTTRGLGGVAWGNGRFVAVGQSTILTSPDGLNWTAPISAPSRGFSGVIWGNNQFVVVGASDIVMTSPDGVSWTARPTGTTPHVFAVAWGNDQFVAVGSYGGIISSANAITWTERSSGTTRWLRDITWGDNQFVAVGQSHTVLTSPDGFNWTLRDSGTINQLTGVTWSSDQFVAVGHSGTILTSPDGVTWTAQTSGTGNNLLGVTWGNNQFVAVGWGGTILTSPDGVTWQPQTSGTGNALFAATWGDNQFVAVGNGGVIRTSPDGETWTAQVSGTTRYLYGVVWGGSQFITVGSAGTILSSPNGIDWTERTFDPNLTLLGATWGDGRFAAVGHRGTILTSQDGVTWITRTIDTPQTIWNVASGDNQFIAVGDAGAILGVGPLPVLSVQSSNPSSGVSIASRTGHGGTTAYAHLTAGCPSVHLESPEFHGSGAERKRFETWSGAVISATREITFVIDADKTVTANYMDYPVTYTIAVVAEPTVGGMVTGGGVYTHGDTVTVAAAANAGFAFINWTENDVEVSVAASYHFTATADHTLVAHFNQYPVADAGINQDVGTNAMVTLDGSESFDPDGHEPLVYGWTQIGGPVVAFTPNVSVTTFTAPGYPTVLTFTLTVTDSLGLVSVPDEVVVQVFDPVTNVILHRRPLGEVLVGNPVRFAVTADGTRPFTYTWSLNGHVVGENRYIYEGLFTAAGTYTVGVTVANILNAVYAETLITVVEPVSGKPDLSFSDKLASLSFVESGDTLTYTLLLRNTADVAASATLTDPIPAYTTYLPGSASASDGGDVTLIGDALIWHGEVISGTPVLIQFAVTVGDAPIGAQIVNSATLADGLGNFLELANSATFNPGYRLTINDGALATNVPTVALRYAWNVADAITHVQFSNDGGFGAGSSAWLPVNPADPTLVDWVLDIYGDFRMPYFVFARFRNAEGQTYGPVMDWIIYDPVAPRIRDVEIIPGTGPAQALGNGVIVRITATDGNTGVARVQLSHTEDFASYEEVGVTGPTTDVPWTLGSGGKVYARAVDRAGNISAPVSAGAEQHLIFLPFVIRANPLNGQVNADQDSLMGHLDGEEAAARPTTANWPHKRLKPPSTLVALMASVAR